MGTGESDAQMARVADGISYVCDHLADIRASLESVGGDAAALDRLLEALKTGADVSRLLDDLDVAVQATGDQVGVYGDVRAGEPESLTGVSMPGIGSPHPVELAYLCPGRLCSRFWWPGESAAVPICTLNGQPLSAERL
jgi:hypothetical protein